MVDINTSDPTSASGDRGAKGC